MKDLVRPPFANYDVVVYFGAGLFCIPFLNRYIIKPLSMRWPNFDIEVKYEIASQLVSGLCLIFTIYILGHLLAYLGSQFVEKAIDRIFGKISTSILVSVESSPENRNEAIRAMIFDSVKTIKAHRAIFPTAIRCLPHLIFTPQYVVMYAFGIFGYYNTRIPIDVISSANLKIKNIGMGELNISRKTNWFKIVEYCVINRSPSATARMYNYLVIGGLFRSLCVVFLVSAWAQFYYIIHFAVDGDWLLGKAFGMSGFRAGLIELAATSVIYLFCLFSYIKFQRRYAEEAIFAFVFDEAVTH